MASGGDDDLNRLDDLLCPDCLRIVRNNLSRFSLRQREALAVKKEDVYLSFIYQIGIMLEDQPDMDPGKHRCAFNNAR